VALTLAVVALVGAPVFVAPNGGFSAAFPGEPIHETVTLPTSQGPRLHHTYRYADADAAYFVVFTCMPPEMLPADAERALDFARAQGRANVKWTVVAERRITVSGYPGREFVDKLQGMTVHGRTVLGPRGAFYSFGATARAAHAVDAADAFVRSFRVLPNASKACR
jgi:hypothetical protein